MVVSEFIEWLKTQDQDAIVEVLVHSSGTGYYDQGGNVTTEEFDPSEGYYGCSKYHEYTDFRGNKFVKEDHPCYNKRFIQFGTKDN
jgi:hypothetical protein